MWIFFALLSGSVAAILAILIRLYLQHHNPLFVTFFFSLITFIMLFLADLFTNKVGCKLMTMLTLKELWPLIIAGCLNGLAFIFYVTALRSGRAGGVVAVDRLGIVLAVLLAAIFLQESFSLKAVIGSMIMVVGAFLIST